MTKIGSQRADEPVLVGLGPKSSSDAYAVLLTAKEIYTKPLMYF
jgi:hypothetical protein